MEEAQTPQPPAESQPALPSGGKAKVEVQVWIIVLAVILLVGLIAGGGKRLMELETHKSLAGS